MADTRYFIRNDDVGARTPELISFVEAFLTAQLPVSYQVIPKKLTPDCARWLRNLQALHPHLIEFGQHGLRHEMIVRGKRVWREFGPERCYGAQRADIVCGKAMLEDQLGAISLFTPPQHKYDRNTLLALERSGFRQFSAATYPTLPYRTAYALGRTLRRSSFGQHGISRHGGVRDDARLFELSISIAIDNGGVIKIQPSNLRAHADQAAEHTDMVGFMLHHHVYEGAAERLLRLIAVMRDLGLHRFKSMNDLAA